MNGYFSKIWSFFLHDLLSPYLAIFPCPLLSKVAWSLPFLAISSSPKHSIVSLLQSWNVLSIHLVMCLILQAMIPLSLLGNHDSFSHCLMVIGVVPRLWYWSPSWDCPGEPWQHAHSSDWVNGVPPPAIASVLLLCVWRWIFGQMMAPVMGLRGVQQGIIFGSLPATSSLCSFACVEKSLLSYNLTCCFFQITGEEACANIPLHIISSYNAHKAKYNLTLLQLSA